MILPTSDDRRPYHFWISVHMIWVFFLYQDWSSGRVNVLGNMFPISENYLWSSSDDVSRKQISGGRIPLSIMRFITIPAKQALICPALIFDWSRKFDAQDLSRRRNSPGGRFRGNVPKWLVHWEGRGRAVLWMMSDSVSVGVEVITHFLRSTPGQ